MGATGKRDEGEYAQLAHEVVFGVGWRGYRPRTTVPPGSERGWLLGPGYCTYLARTDQKQLRFKQTDLFRLVFAEDDVVDEGFVFPTARRDNVPPLCGCLSSQGSFFSGGFEATMP